MKKRITLALSLSFLFINPLLCLADFKNDDLELARKLHKKDSVLIFPEISKDTYQKDFSKLDKKSRWRLKIHGLRYAGLHPAIWGIRNFDKTDNRALVPIRPFYFRASERDDFQLKSISIRFKFDPVSQQSMSAAPHVHEPMLEINFAGKFQNGIKGEMPKLDRSYVLRFNAAPNFESGLFYASHSKRIKLKEADIPRLETNKWYDLNIYFEKNSLKCILDGKEVIKFSSEPSQILNSGLLSLINSWHPLMIDSLQVKGKLKDEKEDIDINFSGLVKGL